MEESIEDIGKTEVLLALNLLLERIMLIFRINTSLKISMSIIETLT